MYVCTYKNSHVRIHVQVHQTLCTWRMSRCLTCVLNAQLNEVKDLARCCANVTRMTGATCTPCHFFIVIYFLLKLMDHQRLILVANITQK